MRTSETAVRDDGLLTIVPHSKLQPSATNPRPRSDFAGPAFDDLVASIRANGILVPLIVRAIQPVQPNADLRNPNRKGGTAPTPPIMYEIVAGHRRWEAARAAGLATASEGVPVRILQLSDTEAREVQLVENLQRTDMQPLEEGGDRLPRRLERKRTHHQVDSGAPCMDSRPPAFRCCCQRDEARRSRAGGCICWMP